MDCADRLRCLPLSLTCIEPFPERLKLLLRPDDKLEIIERQVQDVKSSIVESLVSNDILFIDSTHVMKTGSDVHYEFFRLIPRVRSGVLIHFHDVGYPFEYPDEWIFERNYSWNEAYVLRAFLMYNTEFEIVFWHSLLRRDFSKQMNDEFALRTGNPGSSIWLRRK